MVTAGKKVEKLYAKARFGHFRQGYSVDIDL